MVAEFYRAPAPEPEPVSSSEPVPGGAPTTKPTPAEILGRARWHDGRPEIAAEDPEIEAALRRVFRAASVAVEDPSSRSAGTKGPVVLAPGSFEWFRWSSLSRAAEEGLAVRFAVSLPGGWDPAANYRPFRQQVRRLTTWRA